MKTTMTKNEKLKNQLKCAVDATEDFKNFTNNHIKLSKNNRLIIMTYKQWDKFMMKIQKALNDKNTQDEKLYKTINECVDEYKPLVKGETKDGKYTQIFVCPDCGKIMHYEWFNYCPHCGTKLDWKK